MIFTQIKKAVHKTAFLLLYDINLNAGDRLLHGVHALLPELQC